MPEVVVVDAGIFNTGEMFEKCACQSHFETPVKNYNIALSEISIKINRLSQCDCHDDPNAA
jgi:hypothetical protein